MIETAVRRLREAASEDDVDCDGLRAAVSDAGYRFRTPELDREDLSEAEFDEVATDNPAYVTNWNFWTRVAPDAPADRAYLRWLEGAEERSVPDRYDRLAEGVAREWGQLRLAAECGDDGQRRYEVRHVDDADASAEDLVRHDDPLDARQIAKHDEDGRYRPLKTAPTLQPGWVFDDLAPRELVSTVDFFYPATVANWHREREGELDVNHWRETMGRQSGIYGVIQTWDRGDGYEHVNWVTSACCDDSQCLKRREWEYDEETDLDVDGGDGRFPCREPCSLVVSAARQWTKLEGEQSQTYEFDLTPSEKDQVEALIDAVAEGRTDEIREADVYEDANRYRARFLRAKLFDEDGNLCGVDTED